MSLDEVVDTLRNFGRKTKNFAKKTKTSIKAIYDSEIPLLIEPFDNDKERSYGLVLAAINYKARTGNNTFYESFLRSFHATSKGNLKNLSGQYVAKLEPTNS